MMSHERHHSYQHQASSSSLNEWNKRSGSNSTAETSKVFDKQSSRGVSEPNEGGSAEVSQVKPASESSPNSRDASPGPKKWGLRAFLRVEKAAAALKASSPVSRSNSLMKSNSIDDVGQRNSAASSQVGSDKGQLSSMSNGHLVILDQVLQAQLSRVDTSADGRDSNEHNSVANSDALSFKHGFGSSGGGARARSNAHKPQNSAVRQMSGLSFLEQQLADARESIIEEEEEEVDLSKRGSFDPPRKGGRLSSDSDWDVAGAISKLAPATGSRVEALMTSELSESELRVKISAPYVPPSPASSLPHPLASLQKTHSSALPNNPSDLGTRMQSIASHLNALTDEELMDPVMSSDLPRRLMGLAKQASSFTNESSPDPNKTSNTSHSSQERSRNNEYYPVNPSPNPTNLSGGTGPAVGSSSLRGLRPGPLDSLNHLLMMTESQQSRMGDSDSLFQRLVQASGHKPPSRRFTTPDLVQQRMKTNKPPSTEGSQRSTPRTYPASNDIVIGEPRSSPLTGKSAVSSRASSRSLSNTSFLQRFGVTLKQVSSQATGVGMRTWSERSPRSTTPQPNPSGVHLHQSQGGPDAQPHVGGMPMRPGQIFIVDAEGRMVPFNPSNEGHLRGVSSLSQSSNRGRKLQKVYFDHPNATPTIFQQDSGLNTTLGTCLFIFSGLFLIANIIFVFYVVVMHSLQAEIKRMATELVEQSIRGS